MILPFLLIFFPLAIDPNPCCILHCAENETRNDDVAEFSSLAATATSVTAAPPAGGSRGVGGLFRSLFKGGATPRVPSAASQEKYGVFLGGAAANPVTLNSNPTFDSSGRSSANRPVVS